MDLLKTPSLKQFIITRATYFPTPLLIIHGIFFYRRDLAPYQFLTGDAVIADKSAFLRHYEPQLISSILFQIPHHGSKNNWDDVFCAWQSFCYLWPVTHNANNKRKHGRGTFPSAIFKYIKEDSVTEDPNSILGVLIHFAK